MVKFFFWNFFFSKNFGGAKNFTGKFFGAIFFYCKFFFANFFVVWNLIFWLHFFLRYFFCQKILLTKFVFAEIFFSLTHLTNGCIKKLINLIYLCFCWNFFLLIFFAKHLFLAIFFLWKFIFSATVRICINILSEHFGAVCIFILGIMGQYAYMHIGANWASTHYEYWPIMPCNNWPNMPNLFQAQNFFQTQDF